MSSPQLLMMRFSPRETSEAHHQTPRDLPRRLAPRGRWRSAEIALAEVITRSITR